MSIIISLISKSLQLTSNSVENTVKLLQEEHQYLLLVDIERSNRRFG